MRFGKLFLCFLTAVLALCALFAGQKEQEPDGFLSVDAAYGNRTENITAWQWEDDYFLYLPGSTRMEQMKLRFSGGSGWALDGIPLEDRMGCEVFEMNHVYELTRHGEYEGSVQFFCSANIGAMFLETASGGMEYIHAEKGNEEAGKLRLYTRKGQLSHDGVIAGINGRGNSTWSEQKKSYSVELAAEADLLGMGRAKKWILLSNVYDKTNLHNKVVYDFAQEFGLRYSPDSDWVDLYLNGEYAGLYLLCERNEVHPRRVALSQEDSFLVARDANWRFDEQGKPYITTESKAALRIYHAAMGTEELLSIWQSAENAILQEDGVDPVTGKQWQELIDVESWVRKYLIDEVFGNQDGTALSQFYYYDAASGDEKIYAGPVWDYDLSMSFENEDPQIGVQRFYANIPDVYGALWPNALYRKPAFYQMILALYETDVLPLLETYRETVIPQYAGRIAQASEMNASRWGWGVSEDADQEICDFLALRIGFLNDIWLENGSYFLVRALDENASSAYYAVKPGDNLLSRLYRESSDSNYVYNWYQENGGRISLEDPVEADMTVYVRYEPVELPEEPETEPSAALQEAAGAEVSAQLPEEPAEEALIQKPQEEDQPVQLPSLLRLMPVLVFAGMLLLIAAVNLYRLYVEKGREKHRKP